MAKQGTVEFRVSDGNGVQTTLSLSWWQSLVDLVSTCMALFLGSSTALAWLGRAQIHQWFDQTGMPRIEKRIDERIISHTNEVELRLQEVVTDLRIEVEKLKTLSERD